MLHDEILFDKDKRDELIPTHEARAVTFHNLFVTCLRMFCAAVTLASELSLQLSWKSGSEVKWPELQIIHIM